MSRGLDVLIKKIPFHLKWGWVSPAGNLYRSGNLRLATAYDDLVVGEMMGTIDNQDYQILLMLSRLLEFTDYESPLSPEQVGDLFLQDFFLLQNLYYQWHPYGFYDRDQLEAETALIALHFHWHLADIYALTHHDRLRWIKQIQALTSPATTF